MRWSREVPVAARGVVENLPEMECAATLSPLFTESGFAELFRNRSGWTVAQRLKFALIWKTAEMMAKAMNPTNEKTIIRTPTDKIPMNASNWRESSFW